MMKSGTFFRLFFLAIIFALFFSFSTNKAFSADKIKLYLPVDIIAFTPDSSEILASDGHSVVLWSVSGRERISSWILKEPQTGIVQTVAISANFEKLIYTRLGTLYISSITADTSEAIKIKAEKTDFSPQSGYTGQIYSSDISNNAIIAATGADNGNVKIYKAESGKLIQEINTHMGEVLQLACSPSGSLVAAAGRNIFERTFTDENSEGRSFKYKGWLKIYSTKTGQTRKMIEFQGRVVEMMKYSPDSKILAIALGNGEINLYDSEDMSFIRKIKGAGRIRALAFSPDSKMLAAGVDRWSYDNGILLWNANTGKLIRKIKMEFAPFSLTFSPNGKFIADGAQGVDGEAVIEIRYLKSGKIFKTLR